MKKFFCALLFLSMMCAYAWADVEINADNFPDNVFRTYVLIHEASNGNGDGRLSDSEIAAFTSAEFRTAGIKSLKGIEYLTGLTRLECRGNELTELDLSNNTNLVYLDCSYNKITELDLMECTELTYLQCSNNSSLARLDVSACKKLETLYCTSLPALPELDVSGLTALEILDCTHCPSMTRLDVSGCQSLTSLLCKNQLGKSGMIPELDLASSIHLQRLDCSYNALTELDLSGKT